jgi:hypothetical protein
MYSFCTGCFPRSTGMSVGVPDCEKGKVGAVSGELGDRNNGTGSCRRIMRPMYSFTTGCHFKSVECPLALKTGMKGKQLQEGKGFVRAGVLVFCQLHPKNLLKRSAGKFGSRQRKKGRPLRHARWTCLQRVSFSTDKDISINWNRLTSLFLQRMWNNSLQTCT